MALNAEQLELRRKGVGSSDAPAICGVDRFQSAYDVWLSKTGRVDAFAGNAATDRGNLLEPALLTWAEQELERPLERNVFVSADGRPLCCNLDARCTVEGGQAIVEAKTSTNADEWGDQTLTVDGELPAVPERCLIQVHHQMAVTGYRVAFVPVLLPVFGRFEFRLYRVDRNDGLAEAVAARGVEFWEKHVLTDTPPSDSIPSLEVLKRIRRQANKIVPVADAIVEKWIVAKAAKKQAEDDCEKAQVALLTAIGDAEAADFEKGRITYFETTRKSYVVNESKFRTLRLKARKD